MIFIKSSADLTRGINKMPVMINISGQHALCIHNLLQGSTRAYRKGDIGQWYWDLKAIRLDIDHLLGDEFDKSRMLLDRLEKRCNELSKDWVKYKSAAYNGREDIMKRYSRNRSLFSIAVERYKKAVMKVLYVQGYFPRKKDSSGLGF